MKLNVWRIQWVVLWPGVAYWGLGLLPPLAAQQANLRATLQAPTYVPCVAFSPDGKTLASGGADRTIRLWDVATGKNTASLQGHTGFVQSIAFSPDGKILATGSSGLFKSPGTHALTDNVVKLWDVASGKETVSLQGFPGGVNSVAFRPDCKTLASASGRTIKLWEVASGKETATLEGHTAQVHRVAFSPDGKTLASGASARSADRKSMLKLWDVASGKETATLQGHTGTVYSVAFSPDGKTLASGGIDKTVRLWDMPVAKQADK